MRPDRDLRQPKTVESCSEGMTFERVVAGASYMRRTGSIGVARNTKRSHFNAARFHFTQSVVMACCSIASDGMIVPDAEGSKEGCAVS